MWHIIDEKRFPSLKFGFAEKPRLQSKDIITAIYEGFKFIFIPNDTAEACMKAISEAKKETGKDFNFRFVIINNGFFPSTEDIIRFFAWAGNELPLAIEKYTKDFNASPFRKYDEKQHESKYLSTADVLKHLT